MEMGRRCRPRRKESGKLRQAVTSWSPDGVFLASGQLGRLGAALSLDSLSVQAKKVPGLLSGLEVPAWSPSAFLSHREA